MRVTLRLFFTLEQLRLEVGNEERLMGPADYPAHYRLITGRLWDKHPKLTIVASGRWGPSIEGSPCLTGQRCDAWDDHYYRSPDEMAAMGHIYDDYNRSWPDVFVGEFAANRGHQKTLKAAVAEAVFMLGFEANGDKVKSSSFAPLLNHINATQWDYNLINFDSSHLFALPSYYMQLMFREAAGDVLLASYLDSDSVTMATAALEKKSHGKTDVIIKVASYGANATELTINLHGLTPMDSFGIVNVLTSAAGPDAANTLANPTFVTPTTSKVEVKATSFTFEVPAWSVSVLRFPVSTGSNDANVEFFA